jgi:hypothetical protein
MTEKTDLEIYKNLAHASIDFTSSVPIFQIKSDEFDLVDHWNKLKIEVDELYKKGSLTKLKRICKNIIELYRDTNDYSFNCFIFEKTGIDLGIRGVDLKKRVPNEETIDLIIESNKIENQETCNYVLEIVTNPYLKISNDKKDILLSLLLQYEYSVLRDENGERYTEILRRSKSKRRRKSEFYTIQFKMSPDKMNVVTIDEQHEKVCNGRTSINYTWGTGGGNFFYAEGVNLGITMEWKNPKKLFIYLPRNLIITKKEAMFYSKGIDIEIEYVL